VRRIGILLIGSATQRAALERTMLDELGRNVGRHAVQTLLLAQD
jgi:hypothetical protein